MNTFFTRLAFNTKLRRKVYLRLAQQLRYNVSEITALQGIEQQQRKRKNKHLGDMFAHIIEQKGHGRKIGTSLAPFVPADEIMLIQACETSGSLEKGLQLAAMIIKAKSEIHKAVRQACAYPIMLCLLLVAMLVVIATMVIPNFALVSDPDTWTGSAYVLYVISNVITSPIGVMFAIFLVAGICLLIYSLPNLTGSIRISLDKYPPYSFYRLTIGATWLFTVANLLKAGMLPNDIFNSMLQSDTNSLYLKERISAIISRSVGGKKFGEALSATNMNFPDEELVDDIKVYSALPNFEETLYQIADEWLKEGVEKIEDVSKIVNAGALIVIAFTISSVILAFQNIQQTIIQGV